MKNEDYQYEEAHVVSEDAVKRVTSVETIMAKTFLYMFIALLISGVSAYWAIESEIYFFIFTTKAYIALIVVELAVVFGAGATLRRNLVVPSALLFLAYSIVNGVTLSVYLLVYTGGSVFYMFILSAVIFGAMGLYGMITKKDLTSLGSLGIMGLVGVVVIGLLNMLVIHSSGLELALSMIGLAVFIGLTAYDAQKIKDMARRNTGYSDQTLALFGALQLYLDFINIFIRLLRLFGKRR